MYEYYFILWWKYRIYEFYWGGGGKKENHSDIRRVGFCFSKLMSNADLAPGKVSDTDVFALL